MVTDQLEVSVIVPTFREAENLTILIPQIAEAMDLAGIKYELIIVDDDSQDGTIDACECLAQSFPIHLMTRRGERGLATAVVCGLHAARGEILVVMDADLSHPPSAVPDLVKACRSPLADFVIGSRYAEGGSIDSNWTRYRHLNSRIASWLARGLTTVKDPMAGFFAIKKVIVEQATDMRPLGYKIGLELIVRCGCRRVVEVPIAFRDRAFGESKLTTSQQLLYLQHLGRLYSAKYAGLSRFVRFGLVGLSGMVVDLAALMLLRLAAPFWLARGLAIWVAMTWNFLLHRRYTFEVSAIGSNLRQYIEFSGACLLGASVNWIVSMSVASMVPMLPGRLLIASAIGVVSGSILNFFICDRTVFKQPASGDVLPMASEQEVIALEMPSHRPEYSAETQLRRSA